MLPKTNRIIVPFSLLSHSGPQKLRLSDFTFKQAQFIFRSPPLKHTIDSSERKCHGIRCTHTNTATHSTSTCDSTTKAPPSPKKVHSLEPPPKKIQLFRCKKQNTKKVQLFGCCFGSRAPLRTLLCRRFLSPALAIGLFAIPLTFTLRPVRRVFACRYAPYFVCALL